MSLPIKKHLNEHSEEIQKNKTEAKQEINKEDNNISNHQISQNINLINSPANSNNKFDSANSNISDKSVNSNYNFTKNNIDDKNSNLNQNLDIVSSNINNNDKFIINKEASFNFNIDAKSSQSRQSKNSKISTCLSIILMTMNRQDIENLLMNIRKTIELQEKLMDEQIDDFFNQLKLKFKEIIKDKNNFQIFSSLFTEINLEEKNKIILELLQKLSEDNTNQEKADNSTRKEKTENDGDKNKDIASFRININNKIIKSNFIISSDNNESINELGIFSKENILKAFTSTNVTIELQKKLRTISKEDIDYIINQLKGIFREIINDKNGNYFCNDLFKECNQEQRLEILNELYQTLSEDCLNHYSCYPIQTLIDRASSEIEYRYILYSFNDYNKLLLASLDPNGAYIIQKIIERIPDRYRTEFNFIFSSFIGYISRKKFGIVTVKKFISLTKNDSITDQILPFVVKNFMNLAIDQYANYLIQFLLEKWNNTPEGNEIKKLIFDNFDKLMAKKYSSFVCEQYIKMLHPEKRKELINSLDIKKIIKSNNHHSKKILTLLGVFNNSNNISNLNQNFPDNQTIHNQNSNYYSNINNPNNFIPYAQNSNYYSNFIIPNYFMPYAQNSNYYISNNANDNSSSFILNSNCYNNINSPDSSKLYNQNPNSNNAKNSPDNSMP